MRKELPMYPRNRPTIDRFVIMGNSTSDRGTFMKRKLFGFIPISLIASIFQKTHNGRFTNGYTWADNAGAMFASSTLAKHLVNKHRHIMDTTDVADAIIGRDAHVMKEFAGAYNLNDDKLIKYQQANYFRLYAEGGLTSADYRCKFTLNPLKEIPRLIVSSLARQRRKLIADDQDSHIPCSIKEKTLMIEWSGGNDLITVNSKPDRESAIRGVNARIDNLLALIQHGYQNFVLITMPDLSVTPRFQAQSLEARNNAKIISDYFNDELKRRCQELKHNRPDIAVDIFDINITLKKVLADPEKYGFDKSKTAEQFVKSAEFKANKNNKCLSSSGYLFWDDVHPSADIHSMLASEFYNKFSRRYLFTAPAEAQLDAQLARRSMR